MNRLQFVNKSIAIKSVAFICHISCLSHSTKNTKLAPLNVDGPEAGFENPVFMDSAQCFRNERRIEYVHMDV